MQTTTGPAGAKAGRAAVVAVPNGSRRRNADSTRRTRSRDKATEGSGRHGGVVVGRGCGAIIDRIFLGGAGRGIVRWLTVLVLHVALAGAPAVQAGAPTSPDGDSDDPQNVGVDNGSGIELNGDNVIRQGGRALVTIEQVGAWGGSVNAIDIQQHGNRRIAFIGSGVRMVILDVTDPANIIELGSVMLQGVVMDLKVRDGYAYIGAVPPAWFCVVDVHNLAAPFLVASGIGQDGVGGLFRRVELDGGSPVAYVTPWASAPQSIDISDPTAPVYRCETNGWNPNEFSGSLQYWVYRRGELVGTTDMSALEWLECDGNTGGMVQIPGLRDANDALVGLARSGDYVYVTAHFLYPHRYSQLYVLDFSDLSAPALVGNWGDATGDSLRFGGAVAVSEGRLYWAGPGRFDPQSRTLVILDIATDPTNPTLIGEYSSAASFSDIEVVGTTAYLADTREGFTILDCSNPANPQRVGNYFSPSTMQQGALDGDKLYVTDYAHGISIVDVSDPKRPGLVGQWETGTYTDNRQRMVNWGIAVRDDLAYVAAGRAGLQVVDVSDPALPALAGEYSSWPEGAQSVGLALSPDGDIVHLGVTPGAFIVNFDVSDPSNIVDVGSVHIGGGDAHPFGIEVAPDGIAYVARDNSTAVVDLSVPETPVLLASGLFAIATDMALDGDHLYAVNDFRAGGPDSYGLIIGSVAAADRLPVRLGVYNADAWNSVIWGYAVAATQGRLYVGFHSNHEGLTFQILDVSNPASPVRLAAAPSGGAQIDDLIVDGNVVYAITQTWNAGGAGVLVYEVSSIREHHKYRSSQR